jgi:hypothetical protein
MRVSENFLIELRALRHDAAPEVEIELGDEKNLMYRAGYANGFRAALEEVWEILEAERF